MSFTSLQNEEEGAINNEEADQVIMPETTVEDATGGLRRRSRSTWLANNVKRYSLQQPRNTVPEDDALFAVEDDQDFSLFAKGRDYEPVYITHQYTDQEKETLTSYESCDYLPNHSYIYKHWIKRQMISNLETDRWIMMGIIGFVIGIIGFLLHQLIERIDYLKWSVTQRLVKEDSLLEGFVFCAGYSMAFAVFAAAIIVLWRPSAGGSGLPEITSFLNGTQVEKIFSLKTMLAKFLSCVAAIGCGMPIGPEGPMIHLGAIVGAGLSQTSSELFKFKLPIFERFRNPEDRRNFISAGVAAGVSAAFGAPVGGLLFCMEEVSSFWSNTLSWQIFFCCIIATSTSDIFNSAFERFQNIGIFGEFRTSRYILFNINEGVDINILMFIPSVLIGVIGGLLGSLFIILNLKINRFRKRKLASMSRPWVVKIIRLLEPALVMLIMTTMSVFLPMVFDCVPFQCMKGDSGVISDFCVNDTTNKYDSHYEGDVNFHSCVDGTAVWNGTTLMYNGTYNELGLMLFGSKDNAIRSLYLRNAHRIFSYGPLFVGLAVYFLMVCWSAGTSVAAGILVPMLVIGAMYGRIIGMIMVDLFGIHFGATYWTWIDPGAFALIGSASFFGGVARLAPAITVIMMELTNDLKVLLPVMTAVMVAKWVGDFFTHPFFHALLELKCIPFLNQQPNVRIDKRNVKLELFSAEDIMAFPVVTINSVESISNIAEMLLNSEHNGFPVLKESKAGNTYFFGLITRSELLVILENKNVLSKNPVQAVEDEDVDIYPIGYDQMLKGLRQDTQTIKEFLLQFVKADSEYRDTYIDLVPYTNQSAMSVPTKFSLHRAYTLISALGLRHLTVVSSTNQVMGIITRKDLMGFNMVDILSQIMQARPNSYYVDTADSKKMAGQDVVDDEAAVGGNKRVEEDKSEETVPSANGETKTVEESEVEMDSVLASSC